MNEASPKAMDKQDKQMDKAIMQLELEGIKEGIVIQVGTSCSCKHCAIVLYRQVHTKTYMCLAAFMFSFVRIYNLSYFN